jgi:membrane-bound metal-dependent hydrolase YbcI (DUF457 family)
MSKAREILTECFAVWLCGVLASLYVTFGIEYQMAAASHAANPQYLDPTDSIPLYLLYGGVVGFMIGSVSAIGLLVWKRLITDQWSRGFTARLIEQTVAALLPILLIWLVLYQLSERAAATHLVPIVLIVLVLSALGAFLGRPQSAR